MPMSIAAALQRYLDDRGIRYDVVVHPRAVTSQQAAAAAHIPGDKIAKSVVVEDEDHYVVVLVPASRNVELAAVRAQLGGQCGLASERETASLFRDCERGAIPALAQAYGLPVMVDRALLECDPVYVQAGTHDELIRLPGDEFRRLMSETLAGEFSGAESKRR
jgi:Ala-tRNA(Pro) deacylase